MNSLISQLTPQQMNMFELAKFDREIAQIYDLEVQRLQCLFSHEAMQFSNEEYLLLPTKSELLDYQCSVERAITKQNVAIPIPRSGCICGLKFLKQDNISSGLCQRDIVQAADAHLSYALKFLQ